MKQKRVRKNSFPRKSLSQNFLIEKKYIDNFNEIIFNILAKQNKVIEIGPGRGALTRGLYNYFKENLHAVELDEHLCFTLKDKYSDIEKNIYCQDFLEFDLENFSETKVACVGNLPFGISSPILFYLLEHKDTVENMCFILQKEVALRLAANPGSKDYGVPSVLFQAYYDISYKFDIPPEAFYPKPKVVSGVVTLIRKQEKKLDCDEKIFIKIVKQAFSQRRKTLRNTLKEYFSHEQLGSFGEKRAEQLSLQEFIFLSQKR